MTDNITLRTGKPEDAPQIAALIILAMTDECCRHFYGESHTAEDFYRLMTGLASRSDTQYSYSNTICAVSSEGQVVGISVSYDGTRLKQLRQVFIDEVKKLFGRDFSNMPEETAAGELYLDSLAVAPAYQGKGIAKRLIMATAEKAKRMGVGPVGLLVDTGNPKAELLYNKVGFRQVGVNKWGGHDMKHMQLKAD